MSLGLMDVHFHKAKGRLSLLTKSTAEGRTPLLGAAGNRGRGCVESDLAVSSVAEWFVSGGAAAAEGYFFSGFDLVAAGVKQGDLSRDQVWTFGQNLNGWIRHYYFSFVVG
jgi:hypothetical protein